MASETCNIAQIKDEDVLRQMWQETNDFNKKKEIRAHMYKVREQRLKEFYTTGEVARDIQSSSTIDSSSKSAATHHADLLIDHSFQSLKSKEVRDSASPTKDLVPLDRGWNVRETVEQSKDGKTHSQSRVASKTGSKEIPGGVAKYAAKNEAKTSVYQDGDEHNFKRAVNDTNTSVLKQEAHGVDGNTTFRATNTSSKTSSHYVNEQKITHPEQITVTKRVEGYVPNEVLCDPNTKVYVETSTLKDGTRVTTTRYETTGTQKKTSTARNEASVNERREIHTQIEDSSSRKDHSSLQNSERNIAKHMELDNTQKSDRNISTHIEREQNVSDHRRTSEKYHTHTQHHEHTESQKHDVQRVSDNKHLSEQITRDENVSRKVSQVDAQDVQRAKQTITRNDTVETIETTNKQKSQTTRQEFEPTSKQENTKTVTTVVTKSINSGVDDVCIPEQHVTVHKITGHRDSTKETKVEKVDKTSTYDNKRVSIDISPTHDAFARSLRSVTPERERRPSPEKKYRLSPDRKNSQQFASSETITKVVLNTNKQPRADNEPKQNGVKRSPISPSKKVDDRMHPQHTDKLLRRSDTYEERVRQILGITEKKNQKPQKTVTDIITSDRVANRKPSLRDTPQKAKAATPTKDIFPQTNWLPSSPRKTPERKTPERKASVEKSVERVNATATAKEIRKYHAGVGTCSPAIDLRDESITSSDGDAQESTFTAYKNGKIHSVSLINAEKESARKTTSVSPRKKSPEPKTPERRRQSSLTPPPLVHVSSDRSTPDRSTPQRFASSPRTSPERKSPERSSMRMSDRKERNYAPSYPSEEPSQSTSTTNDELYQSTVKRGSLREEHAEDELIRQTTKYLDGNGESIPETRAEIDSVPKPTKPKHITIKKDLSHDMEKSSLRDTSRSERDKLNATVTTTFNITPGAKQSALKKPQPEPKSAGNKITKPKTVPTDDPKKCISTKSIIINEAVAEQREIIVDLKRSKSSREDSPEKVWPVQTEEDSGIPRYPDQIQEPEDGHVKHTKNIKELVIDENQDVDHYNRISELSVTTDITDMDRVTEADECLLTVNEKVSKFQNVNQNKISKGPAPKISRPQFSVDEALAEDECLLSVSDKVNKYKTTVDQLSTETFPERPKSPRCQFNREGIATTVQRTVTAETTETLPSSASNKAKSPKTPPKTRETPVDVNKQPSKKFPNSAVGKYSNRESIKKSYELFESKKDTPYPERPKSPLTISKPKSFRLDDITTDSVTTTSKSSLDSVRKTLNFEEDTSVPGYMKQLDRSLRITSPHRESVMELEALSKGQVSHVVDEGVKTKFGVTLRGTDSGKKTTEMTTININGTQKEIEDVYDLEILETMLETVMNYELRRRIRLQIKLIKKLISEEKPAASKAPKQPERKSTERTTTTTTTTTTVKKVSGDQKTPKDSLRKEQRKSPEKVSFKPFRRSPERQSDRMPKDDRPDWVKERPLRKASERTAPATRVTKTATTHSHTSVRKDVRKDSSPIKDSHDAVTSCYGIGPTDENGMPLFGLKALRTYKSDNRKVQGQTTTTSFRSEGGHESGETTVTKYWSDTKESEPETTRSHSTTSTQKFGRKNISNKKHDEQATVTRRNSVKEITRKFVDNSVESSNAERKNTYKAGLILRTSSFKDQQPSSARESSPEQVRKQTGTFLTNTSKVTGVQDVITRMKTEEVVEGDSEQDAEARQLLNKFLGSQVILAGIEGGSTQYSKSDIRSSTSPVAGKRTTKVTTTITENGIPKTSVRTITHPITQEILETIWDEQTLRVLLEQSTEYEERRIIRARLKDVMAEKEACSDFVGKEMEEAQSGNVHGESLLLPLLQNALEPPEFEQTADSGTESGEDLRSGLILEVQGALEKLSACLCSDSSDISQERRNSLLQLVSKLQMNLVTAPSQKASANAVAVSEQSIGAGSGETSRNNAPVAGGGSANGSSNRCSRRQPRQQSARHTVGVSSEELENARRLMEEFVLSSSQENVPALQKELEDATKCVSPVRTPQAVQNSLPKPFVNHTQFSTPSEVSSPIAGDALSPTSDHYYYKQSLSFEQPEAAAPKLVRTSHSLDSEPADALCPEILRPSDYHVAMPLLQPNQLRDGDTVVLYDQSIYPPAEEITPIMQPPAPLIVSAPPSAHEEPVILQANPIYTNDKEKSNRFNAKKSRMKRANTIDIPKASNYYVDEDSEGEHTEPETNSRKSNYLALRGPIRTGNTRFGSSGYKVPSFEPRTESDKKFLAFINQQNAKSDVSNKVSLWDKAGKKQAADDAGTNWTRKFGNIKTNFERASDNANTYRPPDLQTGNVARSFWKTAENKQVKVGNVMNATPNRRQKCETNISPVANSKMNAAQTKYKAPQPQMLPQLMTPLNKFIHNPNESAFKPINKSRQPDVISSIQNNYNECNTPDLQQYTSSPVHNSTPWSAKSNHQPAFGGGERRVLSLAASKFEANNATAPGEDKIVPRKLSKDKIHVPPSLLQNSNKSEKLVAYVPPVTKAGGVRKLSGQYDSPKHTSAFAPVPQARNISMQHPPYSNNAFDFQQARNQAHSNVQPPAEPIPASFHTTSPQVQHIQMRHDNHTAYEHATEHTSPVHDPPTSGSPQMAHVYYNNVAPYQHPTPAPQQYQRQTSNESVHEHLAVSSKVMSAPVSQQAVRVTNKPKSRDDHDMDAAFSLRSALQQKANVKSPRIELPARAPEAPKFCVNDEPFEPKSPQHIQPPKRITQRVSPTLNKSDTWHQAVQQQAVAKPSPRASPNARTVIKSKSTHSLAVPKQFEAGMSKDEMNAKKRTMEGYFGRSGAQKFDRPAKDTHNRSVNRVKTSQKISTMTTTTMTEKIETRMFGDAPMSRTQVITTKRSTAVQQQQQQQQQAPNKKPMSPFAKFRQMDRANSLNTPPSTPKTPTSGGPMFKFTDPHLSQSASTIKERLLHWCQTKTREYDNIKLDNFSTCWADGLAFCALIHHFIPDAFDYSRLTPNNRRYNFTLAFQVADEKADIAPLLDVDDMVATRRPDWKCVFTYVQSIHRRFKDQD